jgi:hypothetical protein
MATITLLIFIVAEKIIRNYINKATTKTKIWNKININLFSNFFFLKKKNKKYYVRNRRNVSATPREHVHDVHQYPTENQVASYTGNDRI